uniref:Structural maintenance of chromosomes protein 6 n=1 Tax=Oryzias sinensis TaxID=183150 RepID=A0A8C7XGE5_9TELE
MSKRRSSTVIENPDKRIRSDAECAGDVVSDAGILESITLKNFMCHSLLGPFAFGSNVNFVVGNNGSGKSAILTALIVALGGNAHATNRGSSLKDFVKEGESSADVSITLRNKGKDAFKLEVYGPLITVEMRITRDGLRTYKLRSKDGKKKKKTFTIIDEFFRRHEFLVNNPVSVLTQEMSKHFLHSKGEGDKYKFFMKATQLEQMRETFVYIKATKQATQHKIEQQNEHLKRLREDYKREEERYKSLASVDEIQTKLEELQKEMAWALVSELEHNLEPKKEKLEADRRSTQKYDEKVNEWKSKVEEAEKKYKQTEEDLERITQQVQELQPKCVELKTEAQRRNNLLKSCEVSRMLVFILSLRSNSSQARAERMSQIQAELENLNHQNSTLVQQIEQYGMANIRTREEQGKHETIKKSIEASSRNLRILESSRSNRLRRFGEHMPNLLDAIEVAHRRGQFKHKPRGPLGYLISLKDSELALAVEICLKNQLHAFTCDNYEDEKLLQDLMKKCYPSGRRPSIITSPFFPKVHDTRRRAVNHPEFPSVLQALEIEDPVVANCLIDQRGIESILLIKNNTQARKVMLGKNPPRNCTQAFSKEGDQIYTNRVYSADQTRANCLSGDVEEEIRCLENQKAQEFRFQQQMKKLENEIKQNEILIKKCQMTQKSTKLQLELTDLQNIEEPQSEDLKALEEDLQEVIAKISSKQAEYDEAKDQMSKLKENYEEAEQEYKQHKESINTLIEEADSVKEDLSKTDQEVVRCKHHTKHYEEKRSAHLKNIQSLEAELRSKEEELQESAAKAAQICPERLDACRPAKSLDSEINRMKVKIATQQEQQGDRSEIVRYLFVKARESYKSMSQQIRNLNSFIYSLTSVMNKRLQAYTEFRKFFSARCKYYFNSMLAQRGYSGSMIFDHKNETLSITVQPGQGNTADLSDMRSLSGGERSFSTVCFVLSLWAITEAPFRCLDEFDVYMDMVNRRISMDMMLKVASGQRFRQFIFLTPQNMSSLPICSNIRILRLKDPDRGQNNSSK